MLKSGVAELIGEGQSGLATSHFIVNFKLLWLILA